MAIRSKRRFHRACGAQASKPVDGAGGLSQLIEPTLDQTRCSRVSAVTGELLSPDSRRKKTRQSSGFVLAGLVVWDLGSTRPAQGPLPKIFSFRAMPASNARITPVVSRCTAVCSVVL